MFKVALRESSENEALRVVAAMQKGKVVDLTSSLAVTASKLSLEYSLPMDESIILATAREHETVVWTLGSDFKNIDGVKYLPKK